MPRGRSGVHRRRKVSEHEAIKQLDRDQRRQEIERLLLVGLVRMFEEMDPGRATARNVEREEASR